MYAHILFKLLYLIVNNRNMINLTVFCSSKDNLDDNLHLEIQKFIQLLDVNKFNIVYGGGTCGLMGTVRKTFINSNGKIISSNVNKFVEPDIEDDYVYDNINERQRKLIELGDAYLVLPGGYGTLSEMFEVMTKNDIGECSKPIFIFNSSNIFDNLINLLNDLKFNGLINKDFNKIKVTINSNPNELADIINNYFF
jgi:uncharacterized protein (TIGR00730 family)